MTRPSGARVTETDTQTDANSGGTNAKLGLVYFGGSGRMTGLDEDGRRRMDLLHS